MTINNRVVWREGLFLRPSTSSSRSATSSATSRRGRHPCVRTGWGFTEIEFERDLLASANRAAAPAGVFPDGTPFRMPDDDPLPAPLDIGATSAISSCISPCRCAAPGELEVGRECGRPRRTGAARHARVRRATPAQRRRSGGARSRGAAHAAAARERFTDAYACVPLAHIVECRADQQVVLDESFIPTVLQVRAATPVWPRSPASCSGCCISAARRSAAASRRPAEGGAAEFADFLMLQAINRYEPLLAHFADSGGLHPEDLFPVLRRGGRRAGDLHDDVQAATEVSAPYRHDRLRESFEPVIVALRESSARC